MTTITRVDPQSIFADRRTPAAGTSGSWRPTLFRLREEVDRQKLARLIEERGVQLQIFDTILSQDFSNLQGPLLATADGSSIINGDWRARYQTIAIGLLIFLTRLSFPNSLEARLALVAHAKDLRRDGSHDSFRCNSLAAPAVARLEHLRVRVGVGTEHGEFAQRLRR